MTWIDDWVGPNRWKVIEIDSGQLPNGDEMAVDDFLTFEGTGKEASPPSIMKRDHKGSVSTWAEKCNHHPKALPKPELVTMDSFDLGPGHATYSTAGLPKPRVSFMQGGPNGAVWTAEDQKP